MFEQSDRPTLASKAVRPGGRGAERPPVWARLAVDEKTYFAYALLTFGTFLFAAFWSGIGIFVSMLITGAYLLTRTRSEHAKIWRATPVMAYAALAVLSCLWSEAKDISLRLSIQFAYTALLGVILYRTVRYRLLVSSLLVSTALACGVCLLVGQGELRAHFPLTGIYGSKNMMAFTASASLLTAAAVGIDAKMSIWWRACAAGAALIELLCLMEAQSAGALVSTALACVAVVAARLFSQAAFRVRLLIIVAAAVLAPAVSVAVPILEQRAETFQTDVLKKDVTLTGRTYLWARARGYIAEKPIVGHGYSAFWRQGSLEAEGLWAAMGIPERSGFNFHNQYVEALIDMGAIGLVVFIATELLAAVSLAARLLFRPTRELPFYVGMLMALLIRTPVESVILVQFSTLTILFFTCCTAGLFADASLFVVRPAQPFSRRPGWIGRRVKKAAAPGKKARKRQKKIVRRPPRAGSMTRFRRSQAITRSFDPSKPVALDGPPPPQNKQAETGDANLSLAEEGDITTETSNW